MPNSSNSLPNLILFEDEHLLVINKPAGWNTHAPSPFAGEGVFDWLRHREPRWATLAIIQRLDKETSGVMVFAKSWAANRSLTAQFTEREVRKNYLLATDRPVKHREFTVVSHWMRQGEKYVAVDSELTFSPQVGAPPLPDPLPRSERGRGRKFTHAVISQRAETRFRVVEQSEGRTLVEAMPATGRTHQIRVHAASNGFPILGDALYGGTPAARVFLHAAELTLRHPMTNETMTFSAPAEFPPTPEGDRGKGDPVRQDETPVLTATPERRSPTRRDSVRSLIHARSETGAPSYALREAIINPSETTAFRLIHGAADGHPGEYVDRLGEFVLLQTSQRSDSRHGKAQPKSQIANRKSQIPDGLLTSAAAKWMGAPRGVYRKLLTRQVRDLLPAEACPRHIAGAAAPERFEILENGVRFELSFTEGYSVGLFLDQRDNRRRFLVNHVAAGFPLFDYPGPRTVPVRSARADTEAPEARVPCDPDDPLQTRSVLGPRPEVLNTFAYTCGFSVCAAKAGARVTSLDLSRKYLDWGKRNFALNGLDTGAHDFIYGDTFDWLLRLAKKGRAFDCVVLDPPTFSKSKESGVFRVEKDFGKLVAAALPVLKPSGVLLASTNAAGLRPEVFLEQIESATALVGRRVLQQHYAPQPPDFPVSRGEPAYLKTAWTRIG